MIIKQEMALFNLRQRLCLYLLWLKIKRRRKKKRVLRFIIRPSILNRQQKGEFHLVQELYVHDHELFFKYFRMSPANFDYLLSLLQHKLDGPPSSRGYISPREKLSVTLRLVVLL